VWLLPRSLTALCVCTSPMRSARSTRMISSRFCFPVVASPPKRRGGSPWRPCCNTWKAYPIVRLPVRGRIDWKYALGLSLTDPGFDHTVLSEFRSRLIEGGAEQLLLDTLLQHLRDQDLVKAGGRQRTDSTHVLAAVRGLNRLERAGGDGARGVERARCRRAGLAADPGAGGLVRAVWSSRGELSPSKDGRCPT
jgi:hypothetical protein